jgi:predicted GNAT family acetyltransferase
MSEISVVHRPEQSRYELHVDGRLAGFARYRPHADHIEFLHTEVDPEFEGQGLGSRLAAGALDDVRASGDRATATCPFIAAYVKRHPEYEDVVVPDSAPD